MFPSFSAHYDCCCCCNPVRYDEALERLPTVFETYLADGWLQLAAVTLRRVYDSAWRVGKVLLRSILYRRRMRVRVRIFGEARCLFWVAWFSFCCSTVASIAGSV